MSRRNPDIPPAPLWQKALAVAGALMAIGPIAIFIITSLAGDKPQPPATPRPSLVSVTGCKL